MLSNIDHRFLVGEQCRDADVEPQSIVLEQVTSTTAQAIAAAELAAQASGADPVLLVLPSDHVFANVPAFHEAVREGLKAAEVRALVTFGVVPTHAEIGYG